MNRWREGAPVGDFEPAVCAAAASKTLARSAVSMPAVVFASVASIADFAHRGRAGAEAAWLRSRAAAEERLEREARAAAAELAKLEGFSFDPLPGELEGLLPPIPIVKVAEAIRVHKAATREELLERAADQHERLRVLEEETDE